MDNVRVSDQPFAIQTGAASGFARAAASVAVPVVERLLGLTTLARLYDEAMGAARVEDFPERALRHLGISWHAAGEAITSIPALGPLLVVANHPFGAADGLVLLALLRRTRQDVRLLGNYFLNRIPELRPILIETDPFARPGAHAMNARTVRRAGDWLRRGGALIVFPAGEVASVRAPGGALIDAPWRHGVARLAAHSGAPVLPVYVDGRNSRLFEWAGRAHPLLRTALLPRELLRQRGARVDVTIGRLVQASQIASVDGAAAVTSLLRACTYALAPVPATLDGGAAAAPPVAAAVSADLLAAEVERLPAGRRLLEHGPFTVYYASAAEGPSILREIGRLREATFRGAGEGTGRALDLDRFDRTYWHLFVWQRERREIAGAYRLGQTDVLSRSGGVRALYTRTLFRFDRRFLARLGPALELGRSFVRREYQRDFNPLLLLWQGIGQFVVRHPVYRRLIGPVSISAAYRPVSLDLLVNALERPALASPLSPLVAGRRRYERRALPASALTMTDAAQAIKDMDERGLPVLLRQYLKLNAKCLATSVDPAFSNVVDALMIVDLDDVPPARLKRYVSNPA